MLFTRLLFGIFRLYSVNSRSFKFLSFVGSKSSSKCILYGVHYRPTMLWCWCELLSLSSTLLFTCSVWISSKLKKIRTHLSRNPVVLQFHEVYFILLICQLAKWGCRIQPHFKWCVDGGNKKRKDFIAWKIYYRCLVLKCLHAMHADTHTHHGNIYMRHDDESSTIGVFLPLNSILLDLVLLLACK